MLYDILIISGLAIAAIVIFGVLCYRLGISKGRQLTLIQTIATGKPLRCTIYNKLIGKIDTEFVPFWDYVKITQGAKERKKIDK